MPHIPIDNTTNEFNRYLLNDSLDDLVGWVIQDSLNEPQAGILVDFQRYYPDTNDYKSVAMVKTGDSGEAVTYLEINDAWYKLYAYDSDHVLIQSFSPQIIKCINTASCDSVIVITNSTFVGEWYEYNTEVASSCNYNNATSTLVCDYQDTSEVLEYFRLRVYEVKTYAPLLICEQTNTSSTGRLICDVGNTTGKKFTWGLVSHHQSEMPVDGGTISNDTPIFKSEGFIPAILIFMIMVGAGAFAPAFALIFGILALLLSATMGLFQISISALVGLVVVALIGLYKMELL